MEKPWNLGPAHPYRIRLGTGMSWECTSCSPRSPYTSPPIGDPDEVTCWIQKFYGIQEEYRGKIMGSQMEFKRIHPIVWHNYGKSPVFMSKKNGKIIIQIIYSYGPLSIAMLDSQRLNVMRGFPVNDGSQGSNRGFFSCQVSQGQPVVILAQNWVCGAVQFTSPKGDQNDRWIQMDYRPRLSRYIAPPWFILGERAWVDVQKCGQSKNVSCRIVDIGVAIRFLVAAGDRAASPRLVPAAGRPLVLADVLLRDRSHRLRQAGRNAVPLNLCNVYKQINSMHVYIACVCVYMHSICMYVHREVYAHTGSYWYRYIYI